MELTKSSERIKYIDIFRGIGILCMVIDHVGMGTWFYQFVHAFHMPMFFFLAGYCYKKNVGVSFISYTRKKAYSLLVPYFVLGILQFAIWRILKGNSIEPLLKLFWINTDGLAIAGALWFLTALFFANIIYFLASKYAEGVVLHIVVAIITLMGCGIPLLTNIRLPFAIDSAMVGVGFIHIGYVFKNSATTIFEKMLHMRWQMLTAVSLLAVISVSFCPSVNMRTANYGNVIMFWINAILMILVGFNVSQIIEKVFPDKICGYLMGVGRDGIIYVCLNQLFITVFNEIFVRIGVSVDVRIVITVLTCVCLVIASKIARNTKIKCLFGIK